MREWEINGLWHGFWYLIGSYLWILYVFDWNSASKWRKWFYIFIFKRYLYLLHNWSNGIISWVPWKVQINKYVINFLRISEIKQWTINKNNLTNIKQTQNKVKYNLLQHKTQDFPLNQPSKAVSSCRKSRNSQTMKIEFSFIYNNNDIIERLKQHPPQ